MGGLGRQPTTLFLALALAATGLAVAAADGAVRPGTLAFSAMRTPKNCIKKNGLWQTVFATGRYAIPRLYYRFKPTECAWYHVRAANPAGPSPWVGFRTDNTYGNDPDLRRPQQICPA